jgi:predicted alpha-1,6-mannanase (GH76 family)
MSPKCVIWNFQILQGFKSQVGDDGWKRFTDQFPPPLRERMSQQYGVWWLTASVLHIHGAGLRRKEKKKRKAKKKKKKNVSCFLSG